MIGDVPVVHFVPVDGQDGRVADPAEETRAFEGEDDATAGRLVVGGKDPEQALADPRERQLHVVIPQVDDQAATFFLYETLQRLPYRFEGIIPGDALQLFHRTRGIEAYCVLFREKVHEVAVDQQGDPLSRRLGRQMIDQPLGFGTRVEDLPTRFVSTEVQVGNDVELIKFRKDVEGNRYLWAHDLSRRIIDKWLCAFRLFSC
ncbi:MAG TPA: hypothetical protein VGG20_22830 [Thermoanaerobaculia bacterium]